MKPGYNKLLRRNQFLIGPEAFSINGWETLSFRGFQMAYHPDLNVERFAQGSVEVLLLGYIIDPYNPGYTNGEIIREILANYNPDNPDTIFTTIASYSGRWILIVDDGSNMRIIHDAAGLRQIVYTDTTLSQKLWCASQVDLIAETIGLKPDEDAYQFIKFFEKISPEYWWPGNSTLYREIKRLLPNHYLDLNTEKCVRFWPDKNFSPISLEDGIKKLIRLFKGSIQAASNRFEIALGTSAGLDSRLLLAACKDVKEKVTFYTEKKPRMEDKHPDIIVPGMLFKDLGIPHHQFFSNEVKDDDFIRLYKNHTSLAHDFRIAKMYACLNYFKHAKVAMTGNVSETARCYHRSALSQGENLDGKKLSQENGMQNHPFSVKKFQNYLDSINTTYNYNVLDIFHWEQRAGSWFTGNVLEFELAWKELFFPYNNRELLMTFLCIDEKYRVAPDYKIYTLLIEAMWPELLNYPINPPQKNIKYYTRHAKNKLHWLKNKITGKLAIL